LSARYDLALDSLGLHLLPVDILAAAGTCHRVFGYFGPPGPESYYGPAIVQLVATAIALIDLWRMRPGRMNWWRRWWRW
jgi:hypothetical protein